MKMIDAHAHLGWDCVFDEDFTKEALLHKHESLQVNTTIVQPGTCFDLESVQMQHDAIAALAKAYPGQFYGMANPSPHLPEEVYMAEVRRCVKALGFVGIKLHPAAHAAPPGGKDSRKAFEAARELQVPLMIHTGAGIPFANPANILPLAEEFSDVSVVMAHSGMMITTGEVFIVMDHCANTYADVSWIGGFQVERLVKRFGAHRLLLASDHAENCSTEIEKIRSSRISEEDKSWILGKSAEKLYKL